MKIKRGEPGKTEHDSLQKQAGSGTVRTLKGVHPKGSKSSPLFGMQGERAVRKKTSSNKFRHRRGRGGEGWRQPRRRYNKGGRHKHGGEGGKKILIG